MLGDLESNYPPNTPYFKPFSLWSFSPSDLSVSLSHLRFQVSVQLKDSPDFLDVSGKKEPESHCVCADGRQTVSWAVKPKSLGEGRSPTDNALLKDRMHQWEPYVQCYFSQRKTPQMVGSFLFFILSGYQEKYPHFPHLHLCLGFSVSLASSLCYLHSCSKKVTKH